MLGVRRRELCRGARRQGDNARIDDAHVANTNAECLGHRLPLDAIGAGEHAQEHLPRHIRERGREPIVEAAFLGHHASQVEELAPCRRDAAMLVSDRATDEREQDVPDVEQPIALHGAEATRQREQRIAIEQAREHRGDRGMDGRGLRAVACRHREPHAATRAAPLQPCEITPFLTDCRWGSVALALGQLKRE